MTALLSLIIPTHNRGAVLREGLQSIRAHGDGVRVEVIVVDDSSTDDTEQIVTEGFPEVRYFCTALDGGPGPARNYGLKQARGSHFLPFDSDFVLLPGALSAISAALPTAPYLLFPCVRRPGGQRMDELRGDRWFSHEDLLLGRVSGELIPVVSLELMREHGLEYPLFRSGGEVLLWARLARVAQPRFVDRPIVEYRTDVPGRICTAQHQIAHARDMAHIAEAVAQEIEASGGDTREAHAVRARWLTAAGAYSIVSGDAAAGRARLLQAFRLGSWRALPIGLLSLLGSRAFRKIFALVRERQLGG